MKPPHAVNCHPTGSKARPGGDARKGGPRCKLAAEAEGVMTTLTPARGAVSWRRVGALAAAIVPIVVLWNTWLVYPLKILVVFFHELSHGVAALLTGGSLIRIEVVREQGGLCVTAGGSPFLITSAGYLGSLLWGGFALVLASRSRRDRLATAALGTIILIVTLLWVRPLLGFGFLFHLGAGAVILAAAATLPDALNDGFLKVFGLASCLYVIPDIYSDTIARSALRSDARALAELTGLPTVLWGGLWILAALALASFFLIQSCREPGSAARSGQDVNG